MIQIEVTITCTIIGGDNFENAKELLEHLSLSENEFTLLIDTGMDELDCQMVIAEVTEND